MHDDIGVRLLLGDFVEVIEEGCFVTIVGNIGRSIDDKHNYEWVSLEVNFQNLFRDFLSSHVRVCEYFANQ